jgi:hypothetical protein
VIAKAVCGNIRNEVLELFGGKSEFEELHHAGIDHDYLHPKNME